MKASLLWVCLEGAQKKQESNRKEKKYIQIKKILTFIYSLFYNFLCTLLLVLPLKVGCIEVLITQNDFAACWNLKLKWQWIYPLV